MTGILKVYGADWCPHCRLTVEFLKNNDIAFEYYYIESEPEDVVKKIVEVNGGEDWVIPTLEYNGSWVPGKFFDPIELKNDLEKMGIACP